MFQTNDALYLEKKKWSTISHSSVEAKYCTLTHATSEMVWLCWLFTDMSIHITTPTPLYCDGKSDVQIGHNEIFYEGTKLIEIDSHFVQRHLQQGKLLSTALLWITSLNSSSSVSP